MLQSLSAGVSGLQNFQTSMDVIGNNISNSNTTGYKSSRANFSDQLSQTLSTGAQVGNGVLTSSIQTNFTQGTINNTNNKSDLAISGNGFFIVRDPVSGESYVTRSGNFTVDTNGYLVTASGARVQGYSDSSMSTTGDIQINADGNTNTNTAADATYASYSIDTTGTITVKMSDGTTFARAQVLLQNFTNPNALVSAGNNLYSNMSNAGPTSETYTAPGSSGMGYLRTSALESSNVDLTSEMANMIVVERGFQANSKIITTSDEMLQEVINLKR